jgi:hypothetical protein
VGKEITGLKKRISYAMLTMSMLLSIRGLPAMAQDKAKEVSDERAGTKGEAKGKKKKGTDKSTSKKSSKGKKGGVSDEKGGTKKSNN